MKKKGKSFEIVLVSRDRSPDEFVEYYKKMPWLAVTWDNLPTIAEKAGRLLKLAGIPHFVILDGYDASIITLNGRDMVKKDK